LGRKGAEKIFEYQLSDQEMSALQKSAQGVKENIVKLNL
jgi:malate/lactate dehydrogenase